MVTNCKTINGIQFEEMLAYGLARLKVAENEVNKLNVFPVPDGDTGSNMRMTYEAGLSALKSKSTQHIGEAAAIFARGMLLGARGNSGVILSQIYKGIAGGLADYQTATCKQFAAAFKKGVEKSYKAVVKPVEGTMLTVFRECSEDTEQLAEKGVTFCEFLNAVCDECEISLNNTPNLLPVLKEAGVIDSGGAGLLSIFRGYKSYFMGESIETEEVASVAPAAMTGGEQEFGYCTEFLLELPAERDDFDVDEIVKQLENIGGESIVALRDDNIVKVHVHVLHPGDVLNIAQQYGEFMSIKIENMTLQHNELIAAESVQKEKLPAAVITVAGNDGFKKLFTDMGASYVVEGGQSMNPSVEDFLKAFDNVNAERIIVLPNNSNVILTANQAKKMYGSDNVYVVETKTLAQGYSALSLYNPDEAIEQTLSEMNDAKNGVISMEITHAIRDAVCDGVSVRKGDAIAVVDGRMVASDREETDAFINAVKAIGNVSDRCVMTVFSGKDADGEKTKVITDYVSANYPSLEVSLVETNQKIYDYVIAIE